VGDEEGGPAHSICERRLQTRWRRAPIFNNCLCWRRIPCSTVLQMMHFKFKAWFESSVGDSLTLVGVVVKPGCMISLFSGHVQVSAL
jgi:hypothetical protein